MAHIQEEDRNYLKKEFEKMVNPVKLVFFTQKFECQYCELTHELLGELSELSDKINVEIYDFVKDKEKAEQYNITRIPAIVIEGEKDYGIRFYGVPAGYEFSTLVEDIIDVSKGTTTLTEETKEALKKLEKPVHIQVFITLTCPYCPRAVRLAHQMAMESELVTGDMVEASEYPQLSNRYGVSAVPKIVINENVSFEGALPEPNYLEKVLEGEGASKKS
ncbi:MAG: glutaredoxin [Calditrichaeota bacterium]|nr:glutaredoxin [Calditrichota bacterium]